MTTFKGFNTVGQPFPSFGMTDRDLIKRDILNHFHTRPGERVMQPNFGSKIHDMLYEPLDNFSRQAIIDDATRVINFDPRVTLESIDVLEVEQGIILEIGITYASFSDRDLLTVFFNKFET